GYRSGRLFFNTIQDRRRAFETAKLIRKKGRTVKLEKLGIKLPAWHNLPGKGLKRSLI
uniref:RRM domain-containing protein n=1 Tax=Meloidogyne hapla TaxID=6305 RepID=A0A1I8C233_MELHA